MALLRIFQRKPFALLPPEEVEPFQGAAQEREIIEEYTDRTLHGTAAQVAEGLADLHTPAGVEEVMLVVGGHERHVQARTVELIADHYGMPTTH